MPIVSVLLLLGSACASAPKAPEQPAAGPEPIEIQGPQGPDVSFSTKPLVLVLSPGRAHGFAHVGVLRAFAESKIPISAVLGTEMGGLIGGLYAAQGKLQKLEWGLLRFKENVFVEEKGLLELFPGRKSGGFSGEKLDQALKQAFGDLEMSQIKIPLRLFAKRVGGGAESLILLGGGKMRTALRAALGGEGFFEPSLWEGQKTESATHLKPYAVSEAQALFPGAFVVVVDLAPSELRRKFSSELDKADFVIKPTLDGFSADDFSKRNEIIFRGKAAAAQVTSELRKRLGLPDLKAMNAAEEEE